MSTLPVYRPLLPEAEQLLPYLKMMDTSRYYSNNGPLTQTFERRLADHFGVQPQEIVTSANGTLALTQILKALKVPPQTHCVMPAWTFIATAAAAVAADLIPHFVDVSPEDWAIHPDTVRSLPAKHTVGAVIVVAPFGCPLNLKPWEDFHRDTGIPVIIDAAAAFDAFSALHPASKTTLPVMVSLHATKVFGVGEGAVVISPDTALAKEIRRQGTFGFDGNRLAITTGTNAKISEYTAAVGLAGLDEWAKRRQDWQEISQLFADRVAQAPNLTCTPHFNQGWVSCYGQVQIDAPQEADTLAQSLGQHHIQTIQWWGKGCHTHPAYQHFPRENMRTTDYLGQHVLGLPFWIGMTSGDFGRIFASINDIVHNAPQQESHHA